MNKNYTAPDCGLAPNCTVERRGDTNSKLTCQFNYPGAIGQVSSRIFPGIESVRAFWNEKLSHVWLILSVQMRQKYYIV